VQKPKRCSWCGALEVRRDPMTGDEVCGACGVPAPLEPPPVLGGQGRDGSELVDDGDSLVRVLVVIGFFVALLSVGVWAAGAGGAR